MPQEGGLSESPSNRACPPGGGRVPLCAVLKPDSEPHQLQAPLNLHLVSPPKVTFLQLLEVKIEPAH